MIQATSNIQQEIEVPSNGNNQNKERASSFIDPTVEHINYVKLLTASDKHSGEPASVLHDIFNNFSVEENINFDG